LYLVIERVKKARHIREKERNKGKRVDEIGVSGEEKREGGGKEGT
jgi:hypothetical protein